MSEWWRQLMSELWRKFCLNNDVNYVRMMTSVDVWMMTLVMSEQWCYFSLNDDVSYSMSQWIMRSCMSEWFFYLVMTSFTQTWRHLPQWWRHSPCCLPSCRRWQGSSRWRTWSPGADRPRTGPTWHDGNPCCTVLLHNTIHLTMYHNNSATWWSREGNRVGNSIHSSVF